MNITSIHRHLSIKRLHIQINNTQHHLNNLALGIIYRTANGSTVTCVPALVLCIINESIVLVK